MLISCTTQERPTIRTSKLWSCLLWTVCTLGHPTSPWPSRRTWPHACIVFTATPPSGGCPSSSSTWCARRPGQRRRSSRPPPSWASNTPSSGKGAEISQLNECGLFSLVINTFSAITLHSVLQNQSKQKAQEEENKDIALRAVVEHKLCFVRLIRG